MAGILPEPEGRSRRRARRAPRAVVARPHWPQPARGELISALDGDWHEVEKAVGDKVKARAQAAGVEFSAAEVQQATRDSIHALMLIRAYRARGHFYANLDPLGLEPHHNEEDLDPRSYGFTEADYRPPDLSRQRARARIRHAARDSRNPSPHLLPDARRRVHAHLRSRAEGLDPGAHRGAGQGNHVHAARASARSSTS